MVRVRHHVVAADNRVIGLMKCLALFKADRHVVVVDFDEQTVKKVERRECCKSNALVVWQKITWW